MLVDSLCTTSLEQAHGDVQTTGQSSHHHSTAKQKASTAKKTLILINHNKTTLNDVRINTDTGDAGNVHIIVANRMLLCDK